MGEHAFIEGDYETALRLFERGFDALPRYRTLSQTYVIGRLQLLGLILRLQGEYERAASVFRETASLIESSGNHFLIPTTLYNQAWLHRVEGGNEEAMRLFQASLPREGDEYHLRTNLGSLLGLAGLLVEIDEPEPGAVLLGAVQAGYRNSGRIMFVFEREVFEHDSAAAIVALGTVRFEHLCQVGMEMTLVEAVDYALALSPRQANGMAVR
jgi:tetratricopeptide (TPR) repeat protein